MPVDLNKNNKVVLVDLENCPNQLSKLYENLFQFNKIVICYAHSEVKIPIDWLIPLSAAISQSKLDILRMPHCGKNSADFGIAFLAGMLTQQYDKKTQYFIISNDKGLDHVVDLLHSRGLWAKRLGTATVSNITENSDYINWVKEYCTQLATHTSNRPAKKEALLNSIKSRVKNENYNIESIMNYMIDQRILSVSGDKIIYNDEVIQEAYNK